MLNINIYMRAFHCRRGEMLGWRCRTKIIHHVRQQGKWEWPPKSTQCSVVSRHFLFSQGSCGCRNRGLREAKHKNTPSLQCPWASAASVYPLLVLFAARTSIQTGKERATGRPRCWKSMSPRINSLLILDNGAQHCRDPSQMGQVPLWKGGTAWGGWFWRLRLLISRVNGHWGKALN